jgi:predicted acylesterase/phospholipase RssA
MATRYRILSLDGGGSWALIQARALREIYGDLRGRDLLAQFDLVAANSGGAIVAAALACDFTPSEIDALFADESARGEIFVTLPPWERISHTVLDLGPKYRASVKLDGLRRRLAPTGDRPLDRLSAAIQRPGGPSAPHYLIVGFDFDLQRAVFFRSNAASKARSSSSTATPTLAEAVHASSNAPVNYFDAPASFDTPAYAGRRFWDGALAGYNNPLLAAVVEARANGVRAEDIVALSLGTGSVVLPAEDDGVRPPLAAPREGSGTLHDIKAVAGAILDDPPDAATFIAHTLLGQPLGRDPEQPVTAGSIVRMSPLVQPVRAADGAWTLPRGLSEDDFARLTALELDAVEPSDITLLQRFCDAWLTGHVPNQPIRANGRLQCEIGFPVFRPAADHWKKLVGL